MIADLRKEGKSMRTFDASKVREEFPALAQTVKGKPLVYLDNAATTQKPLQVIDAMSRYYKLDNANIHRGVHELSERATESYEAVREKVKRFINAADAREIVFVRGTTEGINLVAQTYGKSNLRQGDEILISGLEHHSNIVPWQMLCGEKGTNLKVAPINDDGEILLVEYQKLLTERTKLVALGHVSNALGTVNPIGAMISMAHKAGIPVLVDGAQAMAHTRVDVRELDADFYVFSGHKMFGPTGIGILYGKEEFL
ncbi:MAG TPA: aminotransferase class V-fold PLP-dependent enzyme, partial [Bacteroidota bacterium]|nr:aminotransferase class V-fold PLP-dependent enzyme [Bacteroidota bacterium]